MTTKVYLGDGAYVSLEEGTVILTTEDGMHISNVVYLEPQVLEHLLRVLVEWGLLRREGQHV
jgi:hypothetical protein